MSTRETWPPLPFAEWKETCTTLHMWTQIVGKIRLTVSPWVNHSWHVTLYLTARGLTTSPMPFGSRIFQIDFDFIDHQLRIETGEGTRRTIALAPKSVAEFYGEVMNALRELELPVTINVLPNEVDPAIPFDRNEKSGSYDPEYAHRFWLVLLQADRVFKQFRAEFCGKCSPVHFFWGSFDLAVTRFSGRPAPPHPGGVPHLPDAIAREAYSQEVSSLGFWPGNALMPEAIFYSYAYPAPNGFAETKVKPSAAGFNSQLKEFTLPYDAMRQAADPDRELLDFAHSTYDAAATLANWDRARLTEIKPDLHSPRQHP
jgi:hypothetical protein